jgi:hypothetical protein
MFDSQAKLSNEVVAELERFIKDAHGKPLPWAGAQIYRTKIRRNIKLAECPSFGQTIFQYDKESNGAADYRALAREVMGLPGIPPQVTVALSVGMAASATMSPAVAAPISTPAPKIETKSEPAPVAVAKPAAPKPAPPAPMVAKPAPINGNGKVAPAVPPKPPALVPKSTAPKPVATVRPQRIAPAAVVNKIPPAVTPKPTVQVTTNPAVVQKAPAKPIAKPVEKKEDAPKPVSEPAKNQGAEIAAG